MAENILLTFLSDVKTLDNGEIKPTKFKNVEGEEVYITNESAVRYLQQNGIEISKIFVLTSNLTRSEIKNYLPKTTHLEYFNNRMKNFINAENFITNETIYNYNEENSGEENLKSVAEVAELIQNYANGKEIFLNVDLTGGMRHINMMMLDIIRLLEYSGIKIERLIYANFSTKTVEEVKNIYDLFQLISGVEEFVNFGSVEAFKKYYAKNKQSTNLKKLTDAMENFADAIKLCRYGKFIDAIKNLQDAINNFEKMSKTSKDVQDILMARLIDKIRDKYKMLISTSGEDDLKILRWCIKNGYLQQALTLYTERVPEYIFKDFVVLRKKDSEIAEKNLMQDNLNIGFYVLNNYIEKDAKFKMARADYEIEIEALNKEYFGAVKKFLGRILSYEDLRKKYFDEKILKRGMILPSAEIFETLIEIAKNPKIFLNLDVPELLPIKKIIDDIEPKLENIPSVGQRLKEFFKFLNKTELKKYFSAYEYDTRIFRLEYMLNKKIFRLKMDAEEFFNIMKKYFTLKDERNHSNHARTDETGEFETSKILQEGLLRGLSEIENIRKIEIAEIDESDDEKIEKIFINHTNHVSENWSSEQKKAAEKYGRIIDFPFPDIPPTFDSNKVKKLVAENLKEILKLNPTSVLCQGEFNYTVAMVEELKKRSITAVAATSERVIEETVQEDGSSKKVSTFRFVQFRKY